MTSLAPITVAIHTIGLNSRQDLIDDVRRGLTQYPKVLPPRWFYDERGSDLFERITGLPEYYQTRTEFEILQRHADEIVSRTRAASIAESSRLIRASTFRLNSAVTPAASS